MIESYSYGSIIINGKSYYSDVIIYPERVKGSWWRKRGHDLCFDDIKEVLDYKSEILIIGKGKFGIMRVSNSVQEEIKKIGIDLFVSKTPEAVKKYNEVLNMKIVVAALHLAC